MNYIIKNIKISVTQNPELETALKTILGDNLRKVTGWKVIRRALDTRKKNHPFYVYTLQVSSEQPLPQHQDILLYEEPEVIQRPKLKLKDKQPFIIGMGPAGLFCALAMVENGLMPVIFDRGDKLTQRAAAVDDFWQKGILDSDSNVQFGEGGAGAFSDGKLTTRSRNFDTQKFFDLLIRFGAPESISWEALPHLGTEGVRAIVARIRDFLIERGCTFHFRSKLESVSISDGRVTEVTINGIIYNPEILILAIGNSARDTFHMLYEKKVLLEPKPFAIGFRISHLQSWLNETIYGSEKWSDLLGSASYRLTAPTADKGTYTFCMCPGGYIIAASSQPDSIVTNGMSYADRSFELGNSAIVTVVDNDVYGKGLFDGLDFQSAIEQKAFSPGYAAPVQSASDYLRDALTSNQNVKCLFPKTTSSLISDYFPAQTNLALKQGIKHFDKILPGFIKQGVLIAPETRTSSPLRILRAQDNLNCLNISNLYAAGEGSGYSGGIISSAVDGLRIGSKFCF